MILSISINVDKLISEVGKDYYFYIDFISNTNIELTGGYPDPLSDMEISVLNGHVDTILGYSGNGINLTDGQNASLYMDDNGNVVIDDHIITMTGNVDLDNSNILYMILKGILKIQNVNNDNLIFAFSLDSERNVVNKSLFLVDIINGYFRSGVNIINPTINIESFKIRNTFNYVYIFALNRYYFVQNIEVTTKNMTALLLHEDVLMSHKDLILEQTAFIDRQENDYNLDLIDELIITEYNKNVEYTTVSYTNDIFKVAGVSYTGDFVVLTVNDEAI